MLFNIALVICQGTTVTKDDLIFDDLPLQNLRKIQRISLTPKKLKIPFLMKAKINGFNSNQTANLH